MKSPQPITKTAALKPQVLVVEDQLLIANMVESELRDLGFDVIGPVSTLAAAKELSGRNRLLAAVMSWRLDHQTTEDLARDLMKRGCRVLFICAFGDDRFPADLKVCGWIEKPFSHEELAIAIRQIVPAEVQCKLGDCPCLF